MTNEQFIETAKKQVLEHINQHLPEGQEPKTIDEVFVVWSCKTLQNYKAMLSAKGKGVMYYELTYNGDKKELYLDAYKKFENRCIKVDY